MPVPPGERERIGSEGVLGGSRAHRDPRVSVNASRLAAAPPNRAPVPTRRRRRTGMLASSFTVWSLMCTMPGRDPLGDLQAAHHVRGEDAERQAVLGVRGELDGLVVGGEPR